MWVGPPAYEACLLEAVDAALADLLGAERALLSSLPESDRRALADLLRILLAPLDAE